MTFFLLLYFLYYNNIKKYVGTNANSIENYVESMVADTTYVEMVMILLYCNFYYLLIVQ